MTLVDKGHHDRGPRARAAAAGSILLGGELALELIAVRHGSWPKHTVWLARRKAKVVFAEHEKVKSISYQCNPNKFEAHLQDKGGVEVIMKVQDIQKSQKMPPKLQELADRAAKEGMSQTRSGG